MAAFVFLELNGVEVEADEREFERLVLDVAENKSSKLNSAWTKPEGNSRQ